MGRRKLSRLVSVLPVLALAALACDKLRPRGTSGETAGAATGSASATPPGAAGEDLRAQDPGAPCAAGERKVWAKWANRRTGITPVRMGDKLALGVAVGNRPRVLVLDRQGKGELIHVSLAQGSELARDIPNHEGKRDLQRVTPFKAADGTITAYADYRDKYESKRRRIACELVSTRQAVLVYDDKPLLEADGKKDDKKPEKKDPARDAEKAPDAGAPAAAAAAPSVALDPGKASKALRALRRIKVPGAPPGAAVTSEPSTAQPATAAPDAGTQGDTKTGKKKPLREVRDCRTFVDADGDVWGLGSELYGEPQDDDSVKWSMRLFVQPTASGGYHLLDSVPLPREPKELHTWEAPSAGERADGSIVLSTRYRGSLVTFVLDRDHKPTGKTKSYRGGWPGTVELTPDGSNLLLLTSFKVSGDTHELRIGRLAEGLPAALDRPAVDGVDASLSEPSLAIAGSQRWLLIHAGKRREARLVVLPVDANLKVTGKPHDVAGTGGGVAESRLFALDGGKLLAVFIQAGTEGDELVSQELTCSVKS